MDKPKTIKCYKCKTEKPLTEFYKATRDKRGFMYRCKLCNSQMFSEYILTKKGLLSQIYRSQKQSSKRRNHNPPEYTMLELRDWALSQKVFHELYDDWKMGGYKTNDKPSCDRTDDYLGYSLDRLRLMTWKNNNEKHYFDIVSGINNKSSKAVVGEHKVTGRIVEFYSMHQANRELQISFKDISRCCNGKGRSAGGYKWKFKN